MTKKQRSHFSEVPPSPAPESQDTEPKGNLIDASKAFLQKSSQKLKAIGHDVMHSQVAETVVHSFDNEHRQAYWGKTKLLAKQASVKTQELAHSPKTRHAVFKAKVFAIASWHWIKKMTQEVVYRFNRWRANREHFPAESAGQTIQKLKEQVHHLKQENQELKKELARFTQKDDFS